MDGEHIGTIDVGAGGDLEAAGQLPCNVDRNKQDYWLVPALDGPVAVLDAQHAKLAAVLQVGELLPEQCPHPHDAIFLDNGDIVVCCWNPGFLSYWKRV